jgi:hypothetical protein
LYNPDAVCLLRGTDWAFKLTEIVSDEYVSEMKEGVAYTEKLQGFWPTRAIKMEEQITSSVPTVWTNLHFFLNNRLKTSTHRSTAHSSSYLHRLQG